jgi:capsular exopolysaccharide synthesis family protein
MQSFPASQSQETLELRDYLGIILRHKWLELCCLVVGVVLGAYWGSGQIPTYKASALVRIEKKGGGVSLAIPGTGKADAPFAEEVQVLKSWAFLERVARRLNTEIEILPHSASGHDIVRQLTSWWSGEVEPAHSTPVSLQDVQVSQEARSGIYTLVFTGARTFSVFAKDQEESRAGSLGQRFAGWGFSFMVAGETATPKVRIAFRVNNASAMVARLRQVLVLAPVKDTNLLEIATTAYTAEQAKALVQTVIEEYLAFGQQLRDQEMGQSLGYIDRQLEVVLGNVEKGLEAMRAYKEQNPLAALAEDTKTLISESASYEVQLRKVQENITVAQNLRTALQGGNASNDTASILLIQASTLGDSKLLGQVEEWRKLEEEKAALRGQYALLDPASRPLALKAGRAHTQLVEYVAVLLGVYQKQAEFLQRVIADFDAKLQQLPKLEQELSRMTRRLKVYQDMHAFLVQRREETQIARSSEGGSTISVIDPPYVTALPSNNKKPQGLVGGLLLGLMGGVGLALLRERLDPSLKSVQEAERFLGLAVFGTIPEFSEDNTDAIMAVDPSLVVLQQPRTRAAESYHGLRTNIRFAEPDKKIKTLLVSSAFSGEGKSVSTANLALTMAQLGEKTLLVDTDLRRPSQHHLFHLEREPGLSEVMAGLIPWREAVRATAVEHLFVLSCGKIPPNPVELLAPTYMSQLIEEWGQEYEHILLDSSPLLAVTDPAVVAAKCDRVLLVVRAHRTPKDAIQRAIMHLDAIHAPVMGIVLNAVSTKPGYGYSYYIYHYHQGYYGDEPKRHRRGFWSRSRQKSTSSLVDADNI